jgi:hypothetical protein
LAFSFAFALAIEVAGRHFQLLRYECANDGTKRAELVGLRLFLKIENTLK